jgi:hypothetical protein
MNDLLLLIGRIAAIGGALLCAVAAIARISGYYWLGGFQAGTLLQAGIAAMVAGCLCFLYVLVDRSENGR